MRDRMRAAATAAVLCGFAGCAAAAPAPPPSVTQIIARNVAARGGLAAWSKIRTMAWVGHIESEHAPVSSMPFILEQKRPNKTRFEIDAVGRRTLRIFDGAHGWKVRQASDGSPRTEPYSAEELSFAEAAPGLAGPLIGYQAKGSVVALDGIDRIDGRKTYRISVQLATGESDHIWVDAQTFLDLRYDRSSFTADGRRLTVSIFYHDFKKIGNVQIPSVIETRANAGVEPDRLVVERVLLNPRLDDRIFTQPGEPLRGVRAARR